MEEKIYQYLLENHVGLNNRVKGKVLMNLFNIKDHKTFRSYIEKARQYKECRFLIGSIAGKNGGYFIVADPAEKRLSIAHLRLRAYEELKTCDIMEEKEIYEIKNYLD